MTAPSLALRPEIGRGLECHRTDFAYQLCRGILFGLLFSIIFLPEFARTNTETLSPFYSKVLGNFRLIDLLVLLAAAVHAIALGCLRHKRVVFPRSLAAPGLAFLGCIGIAMLYGARHGASNLFFDWRGLALGIALYAVWSFWLQNAEDVAAAVRIFLGYMGVRILIIYGLYVCGRRDVLLNVSIPVFDGPSLSCIVFAGILAFSCFESTRDARGKLLLGGLTFAAYLLVMLCLRRTYWGELAIATVVLLILRQRNRARSLALAAAALLIAAGILGSSFSGRMQSLDVTREDSQFSADNADHVYDLIDAWYQVRQSPVMGIGLGTSYPTWHIRNWKQDSVMVHNAVLHVWLKYGLAGLACYLGFHLALLLWLYRCARVAAWGSRSFLAATFAYITAQFVMTLGFAPWPYSELQLTTLLSFLIAAAAMTSDGRSLLYRS